MSKLYRKMKIISRLSSFAFLGNMLSIVIVSVRKDLNNWLFYTLIVCAILLGFVPAVLELKAYRININRNKNKQILLKSKQDQRNNRILAIWDRFERLAQETSPSLYTENQTTTFRLLRKTYERFLSEDDVDTMYDLLNARLDILSEGKTGLSAKEEQEIMDQSEKLIKSMREWKNQIVKENKQIQVEAA